VAEEASDRLAYTCVLVGIEQRDQVEMGQPTNFFEGALRTLPVPHLSKQLDQSRNDLVWAQAKFAEIMDGGRSDVRMFIPETLQERRN
jgi:hypothetical protein